MQINPLFQGRLQWILSTNNFFFWHLLMWRHLWRNASGRLWKTICLGKSYKNVANTMSGKRAIQLWSSSPWRPIQLHCNRIDCSPHLPTSFLWNCVFLSIVKFYFYLCDTHLVGQQCVLSSRKFTLWWQWLRTTTQRWRQILTRVILNNYNNFYWHWCNLVMRIKTFKGH